MYTPLDHLAGRPPLFYLDFHLGYQFESNFCRNIEIVKFPRQESGSLTIEKEPEPSIESVLYYYLFNIVENYESIFRICRNLGKFATILQTFFSNVLIH